MTTVLCDADGTLFPSEEPAYTASAVVVQAFAERYGLAGDFTAENLRRIGTGRNFRAMAEYFLQDAGIAVDPDALQQWVDRERSEVTAHLANVLTPRPDVLAAVAELAHRFRLAVVSSSASSRLAACFRASGLDDSFPREARFSAEDSLPRAVSKPDPAIYAHAMQQLGVTPDECLAIEDSPVGVSSAVAAGVVTVGILQFVPAAERAQRTEELRSAGAAHVAATWGEIATLLTSSTSDDRVGGRNRAAAP